MHNVKIDTLTLIAIAIIAWSSANILHEVVGHAGASALLGIPVRAVSTTTMYIEWGQIENATQNRIIHAGGVVINLVTGIIALCFLASGKITHSELRYFLWLFATISFTIVSMNLVSTILIGGGDVSEFLRELKNQETWKIIILGTGIILTILGYILPLRFWMPNLIDNRGALLKITIIPVLTIIVVQSLSVVGSPFSRLSPEYNHLLASVFAYFHFILWAVLVNVLPFPRSKLPIESIELPRSNLVIGIGIIVGIFFVAILGPGLGPLKEDPRLTYWK